MAIEVEKVRNVALGGHSGTGKTTFAEAVLFITNQIKRMGTVPDGNTVSDYNPEEIKRQISINSTLLSFDWNKYRFNILDLPGYDDFISEVFTGMFAADYILSFVSATSGVQVGTERVWKAASKMKKKVAVFINKLDKENADFKTVFSEIESKMSHPRPVIFQIPIGCAETLSGVVDLLHMKAYIYKDGEELITDVPDEYKEMAATYREKLIEAIGEEDEELMEKVLEGIPLTEEEIFRGIEEGLDSGDIAPVFVGSAEKRIGIRPVLRFFMDYFETPCHEKNYFLIEDGEEKVIDIKPDGPFIAKVFKTVVDPYAGKMNFFKVLSGKIKAGDTVYIQEEGKSERIAHLYTTLAKKLTDVSEISAGMIGVISKVESIKTGDTITETHDKVEVKFIEPIEPIYSLAVYTSSSSDQDKLATGLNKLTEEDPSLRSWRNSETNESIISGMGDIHLDVMISRLKERFGVEVETRTPKVAYKETITKKAKAQGKYKKQSGGHGQYGDVHIEFEPLPRGEGFEFVDKIVGGVVPGRYIPAVEKGIRETMGKGILAGYPIVDIKATLYDGSYHAVDSSEMAFKIAASMSFKKAFESAGPVILEPIAKVEVIVPDENMGDVMGDINSKRGRIGGMKPTEGGYQLIEAEVPESEMRRYAIELRSLTSGRGKFKMEFSHYQIAPHEVMEAVIEEAKASDGHE